MLSMISPKTRRQIVPGLRIGFLLYFVYVAVFGVFAFSVHQRSADPYLHGTDADRFFGTEPGGDQAALIDDSEEAVRLRLHLIQSAETSIDVSYHTLHSGTAAEVFFASLLEAADRGVEVRILMDGILHRLYGSMRDLRYTLQLHPQISYRFYEPFHPLTPWRWNNRLHDKLLVVDGRIGVISGRNIGDRYYLPSYGQRGVTLDRDVVVATDLEYTNVSSDRAGAVDQMHDYFDMLWHHPFSADTDLAINQRRRRAAAERSRALALHLAEARNEYPQYFAEPADLDQRLLPVKRITLVHNPIQRGSKEPWVWAELTRLAQQARNRVWVQSPYVIPTNPMLRYLDADALRDTELQILTNSAAVNPNVPAVAGYMRLRTELEAQADAIWEYHGRASLHAKALLFDGNLSAVGSFNMDARSSFLSTETMLIIHGRAFNQALEDSMAALIAGSRPVATDSYTDDAAFPPPQPLPLWKAAAIRVLQPLAGALDFLL